MHALQLSRRAGRSLLITRRPNYVSLAAVVRSSGRHHRRGQLAPRAASTHAPEVSIAARVTYHLNNLFDHLPTAIAKFVDRALSVVVDRRGVVAYLLIFFFVLSGSGVLFQLGGVDIETTQEMAGDWINKQAYGQPWLFQLAPLLDRAIDILFSILDLFIWSWVARLSWLAHVTVLRDLTKPPLPKHDHTATASQSHAPPPTPPTSQPDSSGSTHSSANQTSTNPTSHPITTHATTTTTTADPPPSTSPNIATTAPPDPTSSISTPSSTPTAPNPPIPKAFWYCTLAIRLICLLGIDSLGILFRNFNCLYWGFLWGQYRGVMLASGAPGISCWYGPLMMVDVVMWLLQDMSGNIWVVSLNAGLAMASLVTLYELVLRRRVPDLRDYLL